jgi:energy-coupling factor transporter ATP-binding protein EcfA2
MTWQIPRQYYRDFCALKGVSFEIKKGETVILTRQAALADITQSNLRTEAN